MNKQFLRFTVLIILSVFVIASCKKTHSLHTYPGNARVLSFTKKTTYSFNSTFIDESYRFKYDGYNRVSEIIHTKNDGSVNTISTLTYRNDSIYDTTRYVNQATVIRVDTFITDSRGFISVTYLSGVRTDYSYLGKLLTRVALSNVDYYTYNSYNDNFTKAVPSLTTNPTVYYTYYTDLFNRPGDFLQLNVFLKYGFNFYQNGNLVRSIQYPFYTTQLSYDIDADSKITRTTAVTTDTGLLATTQVYDLQYETYK